MYKIRYINQNEHEKMAEKAKCPICNVYFCILCQQLFDAGDEFIVLFRAHKTETEVAGVQEREGRAVPDHQSLADSVVEQILGGDAGF